MPSSLQRGMTNHTGAVCYRLSLIQSLLHLPVFVNWVLDQVLSATCVADNHEACVSCCLHQLVKQYWAGASTLKNLQILNVLLKQSKCTIQNYDSIKLDLTVFLFQKAGLQTYRAATLIRTSKP